MNDGGDLRDRCIAFSVSVLLHVLAVVWLWLTSGVVGGKGAEALRYSSGPGTSADFLAPDEFRQRIDIALPSAKPETAVLLEEPSESVQAAEPVSVERHMDVGEAPDSGILDMPVLSEAAAIEESGAAVANHAGPAPDHGEEAAGHAEDQGLRAAYLAALRVAIRQHWQYDGPKGSCRLTLQQSQGGRVVSVASSNCALDTVGRRALESAALMAQPLPYVGYESVYADFMDVDFQN